MSVTFYIPAPSDAPHTIRCSAGGETGCTFPARGDAYRALVAGDVPHPACGDDWCRADDSRSMRIDAVDETPEMNVSNANARLVLDALGYGDALRDEDLTGQASGEDFLGRVLTAVAVAHADVGIPAHQMGRVIECGRPEGYLDDRLDTLRTVAEAAIASGRDVCWC